MKKSKISTYLLVLSIFTFLAIFASITQKSYENLLTPLKEVKSSDLLKPINPNIDSSIIDKIEQRQYYSDENVAPIPTP